MQLQKTATRVARVVMCSEPRARYLHVVHLANRKNGA